MINLGAQSPQNAAKAAWLTTLYGSLIVLAMAVVFYLVPEPIFALFTGDNEIITQGSSYLRIVAVFEIFMALEVILEGAFSGAGNTLPPMLISVPLTWCRIPLARYFAPRYGTSGIWWSISGTTLVKGILISAWFLRGRWKETKV